MKKYILAILIISLTLISCSSGTGGKDIRVRLIIKDHINFNSFTKLNFTDFTYKLPSEKFSFRETAEKFYKNDFSKSVNLKTEYLKINPDILINSIKLKDFISKNNRALLLYGKFEISLKETSTIKKMKNKKGKKIKFFAKNKSYTMIFEPVIYDMSKGKIIFKEKFSQILKDEKSKDFKFIAKTLFYKVNEKFIVKVRRKHEIQNRFLISR